jgi:hypothetical protein
MFLYHLNVRVWDDLLKDLGGDEKEVNAKRYVRGIQHRRLLGKRAKKVYLWFFIMGDCGYDVNALIRGRRVLIKALSARKIDYHVNGIHLEEIVILLELIHAKEVSLPVMGIP